MARLLHTNLCGCIAEHQLGGPFGKRCHGWRELLDQSGCKVFLNWPLSGYGNFGEVRDFYLTSRWGPATIPQIFGHGNLRSFRDSGHLRSCRDRLKEARVNGRCKTSASKSFAASTTAQPEPLSPRYWKT